MGGGFIIVLILMLAIVVVLAAGFFVMLKGGKLNEKYSSKLMFARVGLQAAAILLLGLLALLSTKS
jgi:FlaG/FlaF family flagellin (archaellin)